MTPVVETAEEVVVALAGAEAEEVSVEAIVEAAVVVALEVAVAAEDSVEATEIVVVAGAALEVAVEAVPCVEAVAVEIVIVPTKSQQEKQETTNALGHSLQKQNMPPLVARVPLPPQYFFFAGPGYIHIYYLSLDHFFVAFPLFSSPNGLVDLL